MLLPERLRSARTALNSSHKHFTRVKAFNSAPSGMPSHRRRRYALEQHALRVVCILFSRAHVCVCTTCLFVCACVFVKNTGNTPRSSKEEPLHVRFVAGGGGGRVNRVHLIFIED